MYQQQRHIGTKINKTAGLSQRNTRRFHAATEKRPPKVVDTRFIAASSNEKKKKKQQSAGFMAAVNRQR